MFRNRHCLVVAILLAVTAMIGGGWEVSDAQVAPMQSYGVCPNPNIQFTLQRGTFCLRLDLTPNELHIWNGTAWQLFSTLAASANTVQAFDCGGGQRIRGISTAGVIDCRVLAAPITTVINATIAAATTAYGGLGGGFVATEANSQVPSIRAGYMTSLHVRTTTAQPGTGSLVFTLRLNGAATPVTVTIAAGAAAGTYADLGNIQSVSEGDLLTLQVVNNAPAAASASIAGISIEWRAF